MDQAMELVERKLARIAQTGDESELAFVTTLLTCGGKVAQERGHPSGFSCYRALWGDPRFSEVKKRLIEDGTIRETGDLLMINHQGFESFDREAQEHFIKEVSSFLFQQAKSVYLQALNEILSLPEGEYILSEFSKVGPYLGDATIGHVSMAAGHEYYSRIENQLARVGLFALTGVSKKHTYYRLFPPVVDFMVVSGESKETLALVYIAQNVRDVGFVLEFDCKDMSDISSLLTRGVLEQVEWYDLKGFMTTAKGDSIIRPIIFGRINQAGPIFKDFLSKIPQRVLALLWNEVLDKRYPSDGTEVLKPEAGWGSIDLNDSKHLCLLNHDGIRATRDQLFELAVNQKLATKVHNYVSTRGGELRELSYVLAPELRDFIRTCISGRQEFSRMLFPESLEAKHKLFHILQGLYLPAIPFDYPKESWYKEADRYGLKPQLEEALKSLRTHGVLQEAGDKWLVQDPTACKEAIKSEFYTPLIEYLLGTPSEVEQRGEVVIAAVPNSTSGALVEKPTEPLIPYAITFPPFQDGKSLVFGRGELKGKIALGVVADKDLSSDSLVTWDIHNVDEPFICSFQRVGMGKSTLANCIMLQAAFQGIPVVVIDPKPDFIASLIPVSETIRGFPDYREPVVQRFAALKQDIRGFNLLNPVEFEFEDRKLRLEYKIYSFDTELRELGCRPLKMPLVNLPPPDDHYFLESCNSIATTLASAVHSQAQKKAYNTTLSEIFQRFRKENPDRDYMLPGDIDKELELEISRAPTRKERTRLETLREAMRGFCTAQSSIYALTEQEVARPDELVQNPDYSDGDKKTVTITVLDLSALPQDKRNPARMNFVSSLSGYLYNLVLRRKSKRSAQFLLIMDEAANYLPAPTDHFNSTLQLIRQGRSLGIRVWLVAQEPGQIEIQARNQAHRFVLSSIREVAIYQELTRWQPNDRWSEKLGQTGKGKALVIDDRLAKDGGILCNLFTTPQTVDLLNTKQILELLKPAAAR